MATLNIEDLSEVAEILDEPESETSPAGASRPRRQFRRKRLFAGTLLVVVLMGAAAGTLAKFRGVFKSAAAGSFTTHIASRGDLRVTVTAEGPLESVHNVDIKSMAPGYNAIVSVIEDGKEVKEGEELFRVDSAKLTEDYEQQKILSEKATAADIQAQKDLATAEITLQEYQEGTFRKDLREAESKVAVAEGNLRSAQSALDHGERMFRKGYITALMLEAQRTAVDRGKLDLRTAEIAKNSLEQFTKRKTIQDLESKRDAALAKRDSEKASRLLEESKLNRLKKQLDSCVVKSPQAGLVIHVNDDMLWNPDSEIKVGVKVDEGKTVLRFPDLSAMRAKLIINEASVAQIHEGMPARIHIKGQDLPGRVASVANRPEFDWSNALFKKFAVRVNIDGTHKELRPGVTAEVEIQLANLENVILLPLVAVAERRGETFCCVKKGDELERRTVVIGRRNDKFVEIKEGIAVGDEVVLRPRVALGETAQNSPKQAASDTKKKFGANAPKPNAEQKPAKAAKDTGSNDAKAQIPKDTQGRAAKTSDAKAFGTTSNAIAKPRQGC
jgi:HlyD family secretion protein